MSDERLDKLDRHVKKLTESVSILMAERISRIASEIAVYPEDTPHVMVIRANEYEIPKGYYCRDCFKKSGKLEPLWEFSSHSAIGGDNVTCMVCGKTSKLFPDEFSQMKKWNQSL